MQKKELFLPLQPAWNLTQKAVFSLGAIFISILCTPVFAQPPGVRYAQEGENFASIDTANTASATIFVRQRETRALRQACSERRLHVLQHLSKRSAAVLVAADVRNRQNDVDYEFRQNSDLLYLTGLDEPQTALILAPAGVALDTLFATSSTAAVSILPASGVQTASVLLFVRDNDPSREMWEGGRLGVQGTERLLDIPTFDIKHLPAFVRRLAMRGDLDTILTPALPTTSVTEPLSGQIVSVERIMRQQLAALNPRLVVRSPRKMLDALREIKDSIETAFLRKAVAISVAGHRAVMEQLREGWHEHEAEAAMESVFKRLGAEDVGYPSIVGAGANACILHYIKNRRAAPLRAGELLLLDCGAEFRGYSADVTRTIPCSGKFTSEQRAIYDLVLAAQDASIAACRAGTDWRYPHSRAVDVIRRGLYRLGIISDTVENQYKWYFPHGSSHCIGLDVHDSQTNSTLRSGMIMTVEPGIYIPAGSPCDKRWWDIGVRIEDDILVTDTTPELLTRGAANPEGHPSTNSSTNLSANHSANHSEPAQNLISLPRTADEIEAFMLAARQQQTSDKTTERTVNHSTKPSAKKRK
jgi:Xaa-Pro aminopeptidase